MAVAATYASATGTLTCYSPPGEAGASVRVQVLHAEAGNSSLVAQREVLNANELLYTYSSDTSDSSSVSSSSQRCSDCHDYLPDDCAKDCAGVYGGVASLDQCDVCSGGTTGHRHNSDKDCEGLCFGPFLPYDLSPVEYDFVELYVNGTLDLHCACNPGETLCQYYAKTASSNGITREPYDVMVNYELVLLSAVGLVLVVIGVALVVKRPFWRGGYVGVSLNDSASLERRVSLNDAASSG